MRFRPCIDLHDGKVKQIVGSTLTDNTEDGLRTNFETDAPAAGFAGLYARDGLPGGHVIMLGPGNEAAALGAIAAFPGGLQAGGGITPANAGRFLTAGASHVIVASYVFSGGSVRWERLAELEKSVGKTRLVLDLSCSRAGGRYFIALDRWQRSSGVELTAGLMDRLARSCDEFLVHAVDVEGKRQGIDADLVRLLAASPLPVTYAGGIRSISDLDEIKHMGNGRVDATVGSALDIFGGTLKYEEVVRWQKSQEVGAPRQAQVFRSQTP